jgi:hypothetical protein
VAARHFFVQSDKETKQRKRFQNAGSSVSTARSFCTRVPQKHRARRNYRCVNPSPSEHPYPHASPPVTEPAQGAPRAIRGQPPIKRVRTPNRFANPPRNDAAKMRETVRTPWQWCLPESTGGEACSCKDSREGGVHTFFALANTVLLGYQKQESCTLWTLMSPRSESVFFASFLCRFGQRNDAPPRAVANRAKKISQNKTHEDLESTNPA